MNRKSRHKTTPTNMPYMGIKVKDRNKSKIKLPSPCRQNEMIRAINLCQDATCQEYMELKPPFWPYGEPDLCNNYILKDPDCFDCFCINFPCHCVLNQVDLDTDLLDNVLLTKDVLRPTKKPRSVGPHKLISKKNGNNRKSCLGNKKFRSVSKLLYGISVDPNSNNGLKSPRHLLYKS